jgi:glycerol uptake facilitator-like aquaporin
MSTNPYICIAVEFIGTFIFLMVIGVVVASGTGTLTIAPFAIGLALSVVIYAFGAISGGHFNPAVTLSSASISGWQNKYFGYIIAQVLAGILAFWFAQYSQMINITEARIVQK